MERYGQIITRLSSGKLNEQDKKLIKDLLNRAASDQKGKTIGGRPIVAKLPHGMDIVK
jgi:hypothetical protein